jgi:hypothetical protein
MTCQLSMISVLDLGKEHDTDERAAVRVDSQGALV